MGSTASREAPVPDTPHPGRFDARELQYLTESFRDLAGRHSKKDSIDAGTFRRAFDLPGLVGERLFSVAQGDHEGVEFSNFVGILAVGLRGDAFEARALLFAMFDLNADQVVDENELRAMLNHFPPQGDGLTNEELVKDANAPLDEAQFGRWLRSQPAVADFVLKALVPPVSALAPRVLTPRNNNKVAPEVVNVKRPPPIDAHEPTYWTDATVRSPVRETSSSSLAALASLGLGEQPPPPPQRPTPSLLALELKEGSTPQESPPRMASPRRESSDVPRIASKLLARRVSDTYDCEGWLYKFGTWFGARRRRHYVLADKNLYQYADNRLERLKGVLFLPGCRVQPLDRPRPATSPLRGQQNDVYHGFVLSLPGEHASLFDELDDSQYGAHSPLLNSDSTDGSPSSWGSAANSQRRRPGSPSILRRAANSATNLRRLTKHVQPGTSWPPSPVNDELDSSKHGAKERILYASSRSERDAWVRALRKASAQTPVADAYELQSKLGTGQFSDVFSAKKRSTGDMLAIKRVRTAGAPRAVRDALRVEVAVMRLARHPHVMRLEELYEDINAVHLVMPLVARGDLKAIMATGDADCWGESNARKILRPLCSAVAYLHELGVVHRDVKPENILIGEDVVLCDFGLSALVRPGQRLTASVGTPQYVAPEIVLQSAYDYKVDTWAIGVVLFLLVSGNHPFDDSDDARIARKVVQCDLRALRTDSLWRSSSRNCRDLVARLLTVADDRLASNEVLRHAFMTSTEEEVVAPFVSGEAVERTAAPGLGIEVL